MKTSIHAMTSEVASHKKKSGYKREQLRSELLGEGAQVIVGTGKGDILFEMELRKGKGSHKRILFHSHIHRIIDCLK